MWVEYGDVRLAYEHGGVRLFVCINNEFPCVLNGFLDYEGCSDVVSVGYECALQTFWPFEYPLISYR